MRGEGGGVLTLSQTWAMRRRQGGVDGEINTNTCGGEGAYLPSLGCATRSELSSESDSLLCVVGKKNKKQNRRGSPCCAAWDDMIYIYCNGRERCNMLLATKWSGA